MPAVVVTHDPEEALTLGDHLVLFDRGRTVRSGDPAKLLQSGRTVTLTGELLEKGPDGRVVLRLQTPRE
jgi:molybdate transport system ATP-binding protein